jgi:hypothetical protein
MPLRVGATRKRILHRSGAFFLFRLIPPDLTPYPGFLVSRLKPENVLNHAGFLFLAWALLCSLRAGNDLILSGEDL